MSSPQKVALITGGASGMGLAVAQKLSNLGNWSIHIVDLNEKTGKEAMESVPRSTFHQCNVTSYAALGNVFKAVFQESNRLDFVFANAGIHEMGTTGDFYAKHMTGLEPPAEPTAKHRVVQVCLNSVINTSYLALHYFRQNSDHKNIDCNLVMTASCGSFYHSNDAPVYTAAKHAVVGFMRSIAPKMYAHDRIRVNAICPGAVITGLFTPEQWDAFPEHLRIPLSRVAEVVSILLEGKLEDGVDEAQLRIDGPKKEKENEPFWGEAVEITASRYYFREAPKFSDESMRENMELANAE
ncbi:hypothetical protein BP6252_09054 [Coleophoma cylindrospora]|uniref:NAD(P)-binding protein n=1 Tax=Coleophoma cylindrospora TaxID=1849047 RepID=A0A3D8R128_9HELO|nr:hypothetical protein BP6252_09054 [Coleophoma cylindrospora]